MKKIIVALACLAWLLVAAPATAEMNINIGVGIPVPPVFTIPVGPAVVVIPGLPVYYAPGLNVDIFFYGGYWWTPYQGHWFRSGYYNGPWAFAPQPPPAFHHLPGNYRQSVGHQRPIPYGQLTKHWREWEGPPSGPHLGPRGGGGYDRGHDGGHDRGHNRGYGKGRH